MGNDLLYWSNAAKLVLEILIGQHYVPGVRMNGSGALYALWQPALLDDRIRRRFDALVGSMPPVCRAYALEQTDHAPLPQDLSEHFVGSMVDAAIRAWSNGQTRHEAASPAVQWVRQLCAPSPAFHLPPQPAHRLVQEWQSWIEQLHITSDANFRITFELVEPDQPGQSAGYAGAAGTTVEPLPEERTSWTLRYYLQARDDPRLLIPAPQVWATPNGALRIGNRRVDRPQERLLAGLGAASRLFPPIARGLRLPRPELAILTATEAHHFLRETALLLENNGFGVILPAWWDTRQRTRLGLRLRLFSDEQLLWDSVDDEQGAVLPGLPRADRGAVRYAWELMLGADRLSQREFEQLTAHDVPLLQRNQQWIELDPAEVAAAKRFLDERRATGEMTFLQSIRMVQAYLEQDGAQAAAVDMESTLAPTLSDEVGAPKAVLPLEAVDLDERLHAIIEHLRSQRLVTEVGEPVGFHGELRPYQRRGVGWLVYLRRLGLGACLADDMGLGKTVQAIAMLLHERQSQPSSTLSLQRQQGAITPALLVCPTSVVANWRREVERFAPDFRVLVHHGGNRLEGDAFARAIQDHDLIITSYGTARRDIEVLLQTYWSDLILDEAQNIKNPSAKQSQAVRRLRAYNRVALTGTPVENHLTELWSVLEFLNPGYLGTHERFRQQFMIPIERYNDDQQAAELRRLVQPFLLRRLKSDPTIISDLPEKNEMVVYCSLTQEQAALYEKTVQAALAALDRTDGIQRRGLVLSLLTRLKQICNHPAHYLKEAGPLAPRSGKLERLTEMLEEALSVGDHALVFTQFVEMGTLLQRHLREKLQTEVIFLHGGTPAQQRDQMVQAFQDEDGPAIFVLSLAGGSGLNLTRANHVFHFDRWWNPRWKTRPRTGPFASGSGAMCRCISSSWPAAWKSASTTSSRANRRLRNPLSAVARTGSPNWIRRNCAIC